MARQSSRRWRWPSHSLALLPAALLLVPLADLLLVPACPAAVLLVSLVRVVLRVLGPPLAFLVLPASAGPLVSLVPAHLLAPGRLAFLVLPAREAVV